MYLFLHGTDLVYEKESRSKELMLSMGLPSFVLALSWLLTYIVIFIIIAVAATLLFANTMFEGASFTLLLCFFAAYCLSTISLCFLLSVFFSSAKLAGASILVWHCASGQC